MEGYGRVLYYAKDIWPNYISCALVGAQGVLEAFEQFQSTPRRLPVTLTGDGYVLAGELEQPEVPAVSGPTSP